MLETLDVAAVRRWSVSAAAALAAHQDEIDDLNIFPIPDHDTGTNLTVTLRAAADGLSGQRVDTASGALRILARAAVRGARGNAGVIMSQIFRGLADGVASPPGAEVCDGRKLQRGLRLAATYAYSAVATPVEGTILSVARAAADAARVDATATLPAVVTAALGGASEALRRTPEELPILAQAGVVDAGGRGLVLILGALASVVTGIEDRGVPTQSVVRRGALRQSAREPGSAEFGYEVQYLLDAPADRVDALRAELTAMGESVVIAGADDGSWNVHVHVDDVGAAIEAGVHAGRPSQISVTRFADHGRTPPAVRAGVAVIAVTQGDGLAKLFGDEGLHVVDAALAVSRSTADVRDAILATGAANVILLPNAAHLADTVEAAIPEVRAAGVEVAVVPTHSPVQGLAAVAVHDAGRQFNEDVIAMTEAAAGTRWAEITVAEREALTSVGRCRAGDVLGLIVGEVVEIGDTVDMVARAVIDRLLASGGELLTIITGADGYPGQVEALHEYVRNSQPLVEIAVFDGGQPGSPLLIGLE